MRLLSVMLALLLHGLCDARTRQCTRLCPWPTRCVVNELGQSTCQDGCWPGRCAPSEHCVQRACSDDDCEETVYCFQSAVEASIDDIDGDIGNDEVPSEPPSSPPPVATSLFIGHVITPALSEPVVCTNAVWRCGLFQHCLQEGIESYCVDYCDPRRCGESQRCVLKTITCTYTPCLPVATCVDV